MIMIFLYYPENIWAAFGSAAILGTLQYFMLLNGNPESLNESLFLKNIYTQETVIFSETDYQWTQLFTELDRALHAYTQNKVDIV